MWSGRVGQVLFLWTSLDQKTMVSMHSNAETMVIDGWRMDGEADVVRLGSLRMLCVVTLVEGGGSTPMISWCFRYVHHSRAFSSTHPDPPRGRASVADGQCRCGRFRLLPSTTPCAAVQRNCARKRGEGKSEGRCCGQRRRDDRAQKIISRYRGL